MLEKGFSAPNIVKECLNFHQTCAYMLVGHGNELIRISDLNIQKKRSDF